MAHMLIVNPSRRKRRRKASGRKRRKMTALQRRYFGGGKRRASSTRRRRRVIRMASNPIRRSRRRRSFRRNPVRLSGMRASFGSMTGALKDAAVGATGGIVADMAMGQAMRFLPVSLASQYTPEGGVNYAYHGTKAAMTLGLGVLASRFAPASMRGAVARGTVGALTVQMYSLGKQVLPAEIAMAGLGYINPGRVVGGNGLGRMRGVRGVGIRGVRGVGAYFPRNGQGPLAGVGRLNRLGASFGAGSASGGALPMSETRVGEGAVA